MERPQRGLGARHSAQLLEEYGSAPSPMNRSLLALNQRSPQVPYGFN